MTDDELNAAVAVEVMGWTWHEAEPGVRGEAWGVILGGRVRTGWSPATNIADAFEVVERMAGRYWFDISTPSSVREWYEVEVHRWSAYDHAATSKSALLPRAICEAALAAVSEHD